MSETESAKDRITPKELFSYKGVFSIRNVVIMGIMVAMAAVLSRFSVFITPTFKAVSFDYLPGVMVSVLFGPWAALAYGFVSDFTNFIANPQGGYFPGYALSAMVSYFIYACLLYKRDITFLRVIIARLLVLVTVVLGLNYIWMSMMVGYTAGEYFTGARLINNLVQLPFHALIITFLGKLTKQLKVYRRAL